MKNKINYILLISVIIISVFGIVMIASASHNWAEFKFNDPYKFAKSQGIFFIISLIIMIFISKIDYKKYYENSNKIFTATLILLILVIIPGIGTVRNGSRSWFGIGSLGIQPSEFMKLSLIIFIAKYMNKNEKVLKEIKKGLFPILSCVILIFGLIMLQPDFGTGVVLLMIAFAMFFVGGVNLNFFFKIGIIGLIGVVVLIAIAPYRIDRIASFINPWKDPLGSGFQIIQSLYAIGPGGIFGYGFGNSRQKHFYLPEPQTDFIFSIISEEFGFLGCIIVSILFLTIIITGLNVAQKCNDLFGKYIAFGVTFWIAFQAVLNLMVVVGLIPVTGVTLPFLSYGGSSLLILFVAIGVVLNISRYQR